MNNSLDSRLRRLEDKARTTRPAVAFIVIESGESYAEAQQRWERENPDVTPEVRFFFDYSHWGKQEKTLDEKIAEAVKECEQEGLSRTQIEALIKAEG